MGSHGAEGQTGEVEGATNVPVRIVATDDSGAESVPLSFTVSVLIEDLLLSGTGASDSLSGGSGSDRIYGQAGNDFLWGLNTFL